MKLWLGEFKLAALIKNKFNPAKASKIVLQKTEIELGRVRGSFRLPYENPVRYVC